MSEQTGKVTAAECAWNRCRPDISGFEINDQRIERAAFIYGFEDAARLHRVMASENQREKDALASKLVSTMTELKRAKAKLRSLDLDEHGKISGELLDVDNEGQDAAAKQVGRPSLHNLIIATLLAITSLVVIGYGAACFIEWCWPWEIEDHTIGRVWTLICCVSMTFAAVSIFAREREDIKVRGIEATE